MGAAGSAREEGSGAGWPGAAKQGPSHTIQLKSPLQPRGLAGPHPRHAKQEAWSGSNDQAFLNTG